MSDRPGKAVVHPVLPSKGSEVTAQIMARAAYASPSAAIRTSRSIEYEAFARATYQLKLASGPQSGGFPALAQALHDNRSLWVTLAADVAEPANGLPAELRAQIFYLAEFTGVHSTKVLAGQADVAALIAINTAMMRGLRPDEVRQ